MRISSGHILLLVIGLWVLSIVMLNIDQLSINSALLVSLIIADLGWTLKLNNDMNSNRTDIKLLMQRIEDHLDEQDEKYDRRRKADNCMD